MFKTITYLANPYRFTAFSEKWLLKVLPLLVIASFAFGLYLSFTAPFDYQQGGSVRIMYVHVPAAWMSMMVYGAMCVCSLFYLFKKHTLADIAARESAWLGAAFTFITLVTGSIWGKPMWGTWWVWDARLTSVLILFFIYIGYIYLRSMYSDPEKAAFYSAVYALIGFANLPLIKFSVEWWSTLHQPASVIRSGGAAIDSSMLWPLLAMYLAFLLLYIWLLTLNILSSIYTMKARKHRNQ